MTPLTNASAYIPGECNINSQEISYRRRVGYVGVGLFIISLIAIISYATIVWWRLLLILPAYVAAIGLLQAYHKFCVAYGSTGRQNAEPGSRQAHTVTSEAALHKDRRRSRVIQLQAATVAIVATLLSLLIPPLNR